MFNVAGADLSVSIRFVSFSNGPIAGVYQMYFSLYVADRAFCRDAALSLHFDWSASSDVSHHYAAHWSAL